MRRIWLSVGATVAGLIVISLLAWFLQRQRDTDRQDPTAGVTATSTETIPAAAPNLTFKDVGSQIGITASHAPGSRSRTLPEDTGSGLGWSDYDGDGDFDLYLVSFPTTDLQAEGSNRLFRNDGALFVDVTRRAGVGDPSGFGMGASFADYDGDGDPDLYVTNRGPNRLFRNDGDGTFTDVADSSGVADPLWSVASAWGDVDQDGRLDLYTTNYVEFDDSFAGAATSNDPNWEGIPVTLNPNAFDPEPNRLYRQTEDSRFDEEALMAGVSDPGGRSLGVTLADLDGDGWLDLYVANDVSPNALFLNRSEGTGVTLFEDASAATGTADPRGSMGICVGDSRAADVRLPSLFITHWIAQENALYQPVEGAGGRLEYRDRARQVRVAELSLDSIGWGCAFADLDLDGRPDLVVANGSTLEESGDPRRLQAERAFVLWNGGDRFFDLAGRAGETLAGQHVARGLAGADFDGDGDLDLALSINRGTPLLLRNELEGGYAVGVRLRGSGASTLGSVVTLETEGQRQQAWWGADASFASDHADEILFGLDSPVASTLCVSWHAGNRQCFGNARRSKTYVLPTGRT